MSAIVAAMVRMDRSRLYASIFPSASSREHAAWIASTMAAAGRAIVAASNAAGAGRVVEGAPRTWAVRWLSRSGSTIAYVDGADATCFVADQRETYDHRRHLMFIMCPTWDAANRLWVWSTAAHDPRPCAWPRPFARGADR